MKNFVSVLAQLVFFSYVTHIKEPFVDFEQEVTFVNRKNYWSKQQGPKDHSFANKYLLREQKIGREEGIENGLHQNSIGILTFCYVGPISFNIGLVEIGLKVDDVVFEEFHSELGRLPVPWL